MFEETVFAEIELDSMVKLEFNEETLKKNFEVLIRILRELKMGVGKANQRSSQNERDVGVLQKHNEVLQSEIDGLKDQNSNLIEEIQKLKEK